MSLTPSVLRRKTLKYSYWEGSFYAVMVALAESFALYFAILKGLTPMQVALISTVPMTLGAIANWIVPQWISDAHLKKGVAGSVLIQILGLGLLVVAAKSEAHFAWCFFALSLYWVGQMSAAPLWLDWISGWMPQQRFGRFISRRNSFLALVTLILFWLGAYGVRQFEGYSGFVWLFALGLVARVISLILLFLQDSPPHRTHFELKAEKLKDAWPLWGILAVIGFASLFKFVANIASPYFLPYMIQTLHFSVVDISLINGMAFVGLAILMTSYGEAMKSFQPLMGLQIAMFMAAANCILWLMFSDRFSLCLLQLFSGVYWAGFDLAGVLIIQNQFPKSFRKVLGIHLALTNFASIGGALLGSHLQSEGLQHFDLFEISAVFRSVLAVVFLILMFRLKNFKVSWGHYRGFLREAAVPRFTFIEFNRILPRFPKKGP